jgi:hypothetical protein
MLYSGSLCGGDIGFIPGLAAERASSIGKCRLRQHRTCARAPWWLLSRVAFSSRPGAVIAGLILAWLASAPQGLAIDLDTAREIGEAKRAEQEARLPPRVHLSSGVIYRELRPGSGPILHWKDAPDVVLSWAVLRPTDLYYQFGSWNRASLDDDLFRALPSGEATLVCGVAQGLEGARENALRRIWVPSSLGYVQGNEVPQPNSSDFGAQRRFTRLRQRQTDMVFEVEVRRVRPHAGSKLHFCPLATEE